MLVKITKLHKDCIWNKFSEYFIGKTMTSDNGLFKFVDDNDITAVESIKRYELKNSVGFQLSKPKYEIIT